MWLVRVDSYSIVRLVKKKLIEENGGAFARVHAKSDEINRGKKCCSNRQRNEAGGESMEKEKRKKTEYYLEIS